MNTLARAGARQAGADMPVNYSVRAFAGDVMAAAALGKDGDVQAFHAALAEPVKRLLELEDLAANGLPRPGNNVAESWYLYYDGDMSIVLFKVPMAPAVQPHDHGIWETLFVYKGEVSHSVYERTDDQKREGHSVLTPRKSGVLRRGDYAVVAPPSDIHGFHALNDETYGITVSSGQYKPERYYYNIEANTYEIRRPRTLR